MHTLNGNTKKGQIHFSMGAGEDITIKAHCLGRQKIQVSKLKKFMKTL